MPASTVVVGERNLRPIAFWGPVEPMKVPTVLNQLTVTPL